MSTCFLCVLCDDGKVVLSVCYGLNELGHEMLCGGCSVRGLCFGVLCKMGERGAFICGDLVVGVRWVYCLFLSKFWRCCVEGR